MTDTKKSIKKKKKKEEESPVVVTDSLAEKHRPQSFSEVIGNESIVKSLQSRVDKNNIPHVIMFTGPHGSGKTTMAYILAKELKCSDFDIVEMDIGNMTGVDNSRAIIKDARKKPMKGSARAWILDEIQGASTNAQEALLKTLEKPPAHAFFFLCTTDPQKIKATLRSRCVTYTVQPLNNQEMFKVLNRAAKKENKEIPKKVLIEIAKDSLGHPRDALMILEKVLYIDDEEEMIEVAKQEAAVQNQAIDLCRVLSKKTNWKTVSDLLLNINQDPESIRRAVLGYFTTALLKGNERAYLILDAFSDSFFYSGKAGLVKACYEVVVGID